MRVSHVITAIALTGCTYISKADMEAREPGLDNDGDGVVAADDCDDNNDAISPLKEETWYDGVDNDCAEDDDYDADADGFVPTQYAGLQTAGVTGTGILPPGDCADDSADVYPGAEDPFYDGVDSDCAGNDDFDQDADGYASRDHAYAVTEHANGTGTLPATDCDDTLNSVNPGAADEPYNGIDEDCAGNDDYDIDGDGFYDASTTLLYGPTQYADGTGVALEGDCDDGNADVHLGAPDDFYDGIDHDCAGNDDFDRDFDGFVQDVHIGETTRYVTGSGSLPGGDCNDDPDSGGSLAYPTATEVLSDDVDHDCDALSAEVGARTFRLNPTEDLTFIGVHSIHFGENSEGIHLAIGAEESETNENGIIKALTFDPADPIGVDPSIVTLNEGSASTSNPYTLAPTMAFWVDSDVHLSLTGAVWLAAEMRALFLRGFDDLAGSPTGAAVGPLAEDVDLAGWEQMSDVDLFRDDAGTFHAIGCDATTEVVHYNKATPGSLELGSSSPTPSYASEDYADGFRASTCAVFQRNDGQVVILSDRDGFFTASTVDPLLTDLTLNHGPSETGLPAPDATLASADVTGFAVPTARAPEPVFAAIDNFNNDILVVNEDFAVVQTMNLGVSPVSVDAVFAPDGTLYVLAVDDAGHGWLSWGALDEPLSEPLMLGVTGLTTAALWLDGATGNILQVAAAVDGDGTAVDTVVMGSAYLEDPS
ncbi:MAG: MopE-related protein [Myxococcota bacterium]|nr:MopE-related protein [Myxococcota bacterium]